MLAGKKNVKDKAYALLIALEDSDYASKITKRRFVFYSLSLVFLLVIQESLFNYWRVFGIKPNIGLALVFSVAIIVDVRPALFIGLFSGFYIDVVYGRYLGISALTLMLFASVISAISSHRSRNRAYWILPIMAPAFLVYTTFESFCMRLLSLSRSNEVRLYTNLGQHFLRRIIPVSLYTALILILIILPVRLIWSKLGPKYKIF